jgi:hypothetical protein
MAESLAKLIPTPRECGEFFLLLLKKDELTAFFGTGHLPGNTEDEYW